MANDVPRRPVADGAPAGDLKSPPGSIRSKRLGAALLAALCVLVFGQTVSFEFVGWDDALHLHSNPHLNPPALAKLPDIWRAPYQEIYTPLTDTLWTLLALSARAVRPEAGYFQPGVFHAANVAMHLLNVLLVWKLLGVLLRRASFTEPTATWSAWFGAALFAVHPLTVESVAWVSEARGLLSGGLLLGAILCYVSYLEARAARASTVADPASSATTAGRRWYGAAWLLFAAALAAKPSAAAGPLLVGLIDVIAYRRPARLVIAAVLPWAATAGLFLWIARSAQPVPESLQNLTLPQRIFVAGDAVGFYLDKSIRPFSLGIDYGRTPASLLRSGFSYALGLLLVAAALIAIARPHRRALILAMGWFTAALAPVLGFVPFQFQRYSTTADRYAYLALPGIAWACAYALATAMQRFARAAADAPLNDAARATGEALWEYELDPMRIPCRKRRIALAVAGFALASSAILSALACRPWRNSTELFSQAVRVNPTSAAGLQGLGELRLRQGQVQKAIGYLEPAAKHHPDKPSVFLLLGTAYRHANRLPEALECATRAEALLPAAAPPRFVSADVLLRLGRFDEARDKALEALPLRGDEAEARDLIDTARVLLGETDVAAQRRRELAEHHVQFALRGLDRNEPATVQFHLATAERCDAEAACVVYAKGCAAEATGDLEAARVWYEQAVALDARAEYLLRMAALLRAVQRIDDARAAYERVLQVDPASATAHNQLGMLLAATEPAAARRHYESAVRIDPQWADAHNNLGNLAAKEGRWAEAVEHYRAALNIDPDLTAAERNLATALKQSGRN